MCTFAINNTLFPEVLLSSSLLMATKQGARLSSSATKPAGHGVSKSHRSYQTVNPCGNKYLQQKWDKKYYDDHRKLVKSAKPMIDTSAPAQRPHITSKWKKQQIEKERSEVIDRDNLTLLKKMQKIMNTEGGVDHKNTYRHHSLNQQQRQRELERVAKENKKMLQRLESVEPMYKVSDWIEEWRRKEELTGMITAYPEDLMTNSKPRSKTFPAQRQTPASVDPKLSHTSGDGDTNQPSDSTPQPETQKDETTNVENNSRETDVEKSDSTQQVQHTQEEDTTEK